MTGLENLLQEIHAISQEEEEQIMRAAKTEAAEIEDESRKSIEAQRNEILSNAEAAAKSIMERGASGRRITHRNEMLALKQELIHRTVEKAKKSVVALPDSEYFALLLSWAGRAEFSGKTVIRLNSKDLARSYEGFLSSLAKEAEVSIDKEPADISGGFLAVCGGVTVNCSLDSAFEFYSDAINRETRRILFG